MHLISCYSTEQLASAILRNYGKESQVKVRESKNSQGEVVIEVTVVKVIEDGVLRSLKTEAL